jgi:hypothetical protein
MKERFGKKDKVKATTKANEIPQSTVTTALSRDKANHLAQKEGAIMKPSENNKRWPTQKSNQPGSEDNTFKFTRDKRITYTFKLPSWLIDRFKRKRRS